MHRNNHHLLPRCLTPPIPQGHLAEGSSPDEGQHGDHHHKTARPRWPRSARKQNRLSRHSKLAQGLALALSLLSCKKTNRKLSSNPSPFPLQGSGFKIRAACTVQPIEMDE